MQKPWFVRGSWGLCLLVAVVAVCGADVRLGPGSPGERGAVKAAAMPAGLRAAYLATVQAEGGASYAVKAGAAGFEAVNPAQGFAVGFSDEGLALSGNGERATLRPSRFGCEGTRRVVELASPEVREGRVVYPHEGFEEWYVNGPLGVEQGFTVAEAPECAGEAEGELLVELSVGPGLMAALGKDGTSVELRDKSGKRVLGYSELYATDATGKALSARLGVTGEGVSIQVDAAGAAYPVVIDPLIWKEQSKLLASDKDTGRGFGFGSSVALAEDTALIGAYLDDEKGVAAGAVYVFVRSGSTWTQQQKLLASDGAADKYFGVAVALSGDTALVGATLDDDSGKKAGAAYIFVRSGATWTEQQKLLASDGMAFQTFGNAVALSGDTALVGASLNTDKGSETGAVYIYVRSGGIWTEQQKILASDAVSSNGRFGCSVALSGDTALIGALIDSENGQRAGAAYVFVCSGGIWTEQQKLLASDGVPEDYFGSSVALADNTALIGAPGTDPKSPKAGAAYVFVRSGATWTEQQKLVASDEITSNAFGSSVSLSGAVALVGAISDSDKILYAGAAYVFVHSAVSWIEQQKLMASDRTESASFGYSVALSGETALIGANGVGQAYIFVRGLSTGDACTTDTACLSGYCFTGICVDPVQSCTGAANGIPCNDGNPCTQQDTCQGGICVGANPVICPAPAGQDCMRGVCLPATGSCGIVQKLDGAPCPGGVCIAGGCFEDTYSSSSSAGSTSSTSSTGSVGGAGGAGSAGGTAASTSTSTAATSTSSSVTASTAGAGGAPAEPAEIRLHGGACTYTANPPARTNLPRVLLLTLLLTARRRSQSVLAPVHGHRSPPNS